MREEIEISRIGRKYEEYRLRSAAQEKLLLTSILERGIEHPLQGVSSVGMDLAGGTFVLLDGFKRLRCAVKLGIGHVPFASIATDEVAGILMLLKVSNAKSLSLLEQARLVDDLKTIHRMSVSEIAARLERSKAWVIVRLDALAKMGPVVRQEIFSGRFPAYSYLYTLRQFRRLTHAKQSDEEAFVQAVSGRGLSTRDLELLAKGYYQGGTQMREQVLGGDPGWCLSQLKARGLTDRNQDEEYSDVERQVLRDLEALARILGRLRLKMDHPGLGKSHRGFIAEAGLIAGGVLRGLTGFTDKMRAFYDRCGHTAGHSPTP